MCSGVCVCVFLCVCVCGVWCMQERDNKCVSGDQKCDSPQRGKVRRGATDRRRSRAEQSERADFSPSLPSLALSFLFLLLRFALSSGCQSPSLPQVSSHSLSSSLSLPSSLRHQRPISGMLSTSWTPHPPTSANTTATTAVAAGVHPIIEGPPLKT